jgi:hypothetical protein
VHWVHTPGCREQPLATLSVNELHALALEDPIARRRAGVVIFLIAVANLNLGQVRKSLCSRSEIWGGVLLGFGTRMEAESPQSKSGASMMALVMSSDGCCPGVNERSCGARGCYPCG